jgi:hypothetical protein
VQRLLATREDIFPDYTVESFEAQFGKAFKILHAVAIEDSQRRMYLMTLK